MSATSRLSESETEEFKAKFMEVAQAIKTPSLRSNVLLAARYTAMLEQETERNTRERRTARQKSQTDRALLFVEDSVSCVS